MVSFQLSGVIQKVVHLPPATPGDTPLLTFITIGLDGLAMVAAAQGRPVRAAGLWGATEAPREATDEGHWPVFQRDYERTLADARSQIPEADWSTAWAARRALTAVQAVAEAPEDADRAASTGEPIPPAASIAA